MTKRFALNKVTACFLALALVLGLSGNYFKIVQAEGSHEGNPPVCGICEDICECDVEEVCEICELDPCKCTEKVTPVCEICEDICVCEDTDGEDNTGDSSLGEESVEQVFMSPSMMSINMTSAATGTEEILTTFNKTVTPVNATDAFRQYDVTFEFAISSYEFTDTIYEGVGFIDIGAKLTGNSNNTLLGKNGLDLAKGQGKVYAFDLNTINLLPDEKLVYKDSNGNFIDYTIEPNAWWNGIKDDNDNVKVRPQATEAYNVWIPGLIIAHDSAGNAIAAGSSWDDKFNNSFASLNSTMDFYVVKTVNSAYNTIQNVSITDTIPAAFTLVEDSLTGTNGATGTINNSNGNLTITLNGSYTKDKTYTVTYRIKLTEEESTFNPLKNYSDFFKTGGESSISKAEIFYQTVLTPGLSVQYNRDSNAVSSINVPPLFYVTLEIDGNNSLTTTADAAIIIGETAKLTSKVFLADSSNIEVTGSSAWIYVKGIYTVAEAWKDFYDLSKYTLEWTENNVSETYDTPIHSLTPEQIGIIEYTFTAKMPYATGPYAPNGYYQATAKVTLEVIGGKLIVRVIGDTADISGKNTLNIADVTVKYDNVDAFTVAGIIEGDDTVYNGVANNQSYTGIAYVPYGYTATSSVGEPGATDTNYDENDWIITITVKAVQQPFYRSNSDNGGGNRE